MLALASGLQNHIIFTQALPNRRHMPRTTTSTQFKVTILQQLRKWRQLKKKSKNLDCSEAVTQQLLSLQRCACAKRSLQCGEGHCCCSIRHVPGWTCTPLCQIQGLLGLGSQTKNAMHSRYPFIAPCPRFRSSLFEQCEITSEK